MPSKNHVDRMFKAFADETRLRILHVLTHGELCVCDILETLRVPQSKISRHLAYLRSAGLVKSRKNGLWKYYSLAPARAGFHQTLINCLQKCFREVKPLRADKTRLGNRRKRVTC